MAMNVPAPYATDGELFLDSEFNESYDASSKTLLVIAKGLSVASDSSGAICLQKQGTVDYNLMVDGLHTKYDNGTLLFIDDLSVASDQSGNVILSRIPEKPTVPTIPGAYRVTIPNRDICISVILRDIKPDKTLTADFIMEDIELDVYPEIIHYIEDISFDIVPEMQAYISVADAIQIPDFTINNEFEVSFVEYAARMLSDINSLNLSDLDVSLRELYYIEK